MKSHVLDKASLDIKEWNFLTVSTSDLGIRNMSLKLLCVLPFSFSAQRLSNFSIGVTNNSPVEVTPAFTNYLLCEHYLGTVPSAGNHTATCPPNLVGRYVIVQLNYYEALHFCEAQVFAGQIGKISKQQHSESLV